MFSQFPATMITRCAVISVARNAANARKGSSLISASGGLCCFSAVVFINAPFHLATEMAEEPLNRPGRRIAERTDRMAFHAGSNIEQPVNFFPVGIAGHHAFHDAPHPPGAFAAGRALA